MLAISLPKTVIHASHKSLLPKTTLPYKLAEQNWCKSVCWNTNVYKHVQNLQKQRSVSLVCCMKEGVDSKGFAIIRSLGDKALFNLDTALLKRKLGAPNSRPLADFLPTLNIKAKDFAAEMTSVNVQQKDLHGQQTICQEHVDNNKAVRNMMLQRGIVPEDLPAGEDVKKVERRLKSDEKTLTKKNSKKK